MYSNMSALRESDDPERELQRGEAPCVEFEAIGRWGNRVASGVLCLTRTY